MTRADRLFTFAQSPWRRWLLVMALVLLYSGWTSYVVSQDKPLDFYVYYIAALGGLPGHLTPGQSTAHYNQVVHRLLPIACRVPRFTSLFYHR
jgi:hypothetical protein